MVRMVAALAGPIFKRMTALAGLAATIALATPASAQERPVPNALGLPDAALTRTDQGGSVTLRISGIVTPGLAQKFAAMFDTLPAGRPVMLELNSPGGFAEAAYDMVGRILRERTDGRPVATRVRGGEDCESACFTLFMAGYPRLAAPSSRFMVHAPTIAQSGRTTVKSTARLKRQLLDLGASPAWIEQVSATGGFSGRVDYRQTGAELAAARTNTVTMLVEPVAEIRLSAH